jgi:DNA replication protein DnaC
MIFSKEQFEDEIKIWQNRIVRQCKLCNGIGSIDLSNSNKAVMCECQQKALTNSYLVASGVPRKYIDATWDWDVLNNNRESTEKMKCYIEDFINNYKKGKGVYLYGRQGRGKSLLESLAARDVVKLINPDTNSYFKIGFIIFEDMIKISHESRNEFSSRKKYLYLIENTDLLIMDNIGSETGTQGHNTKVLQYILRKRDNSCLPTIISSNYTPEKIKEAYSDTVHDFIIQNCDLILVEGENFRQKGKNFDFNYDEF